MSSREFKSIISHFIKFDPCIIFDVNNRKMCFSVNGDIGHGNILYCQSSSEENLLNGRGVNFLIIKNKFKEEYYSKYLLKMSAASNLSKYLNLYMRKEKPLLLEYQLLQCKGSYLNFYLAPIICDDDEEEEVMNDKFCNNINMKD